MQDVRPQFDQPNWNCRPHPVVHDRPLLGRPVRRLTWRRSARIGIAQAEKQNPGAWPGLCVRSERAAQEALRGLRASPTPARPRPSSESVAGSGTSEGYVDIVDKQCVYSTDTSKLSG
jgi:hypothetical protein